MTSQRNFLSCRIGQEWYGIDIRSVIEVLHLIAINELPGSDFMGVMTLRNMIMPVVDLRLVFGMPDVEYHLDTPIIAVTLGDKRAGLIVDEADTVVEVPSDRLEPYSDHFTHMVARLDNRLLFLLDLEQLLAGSKNEA